MPKDEILENHHLQKTVLELAVMLEVRGLFYDAPDAD